MIRGQSRNLPCPRRLPTKHRANGPGPPGVFAEGPTSASLHGQFPGQLRINMVFKAHAGLHLDNIPDDITVPEFLFNEKYGRRPLSQSNRAVMIDAPSGA